MPKKRTEWRVVSTVDPNEYSRKGFADGRWLFALGVIGLIVVCCLPSARAKGISHRMAWHRRYRADVAGAVLCGVSVLIILGCSFIEALIQTVTTSRTG